MSKTQRVDAGAAANFAAYIAFGRSLAVQRGIHWDIALDADGEACDGEGWDLTAIMGGTPPPRHLLTKFGYETKVLAALRAKSASAPSDGAMAEAWQDLLKAYACELLLSKEVKTGSVAQFTRALRVVATVCAPRLPWQVVPDDFHAATTLADEIQPSGTLGVCVRSVARLLFDAHHLSPAGPFSKLVDRTEVRKHRRAKFTTNRDALLDKLDQRKRAERLPDKRAFWELVRIVFTETPLTFTDFISFAQAKALIFCGVRIGEGALIPLDWKRERHYFTSDGTPAGKVGGRSTALLLRHFAEKQGTKSGDSTLLVEQGQYVPEIFQGLLTETLDEVARATEPLRKTLRMQKATGRLLPWFEPDELVEPRLLMPHLTGNALWARTQPDGVADLVQSYRRSLDPTIFTKLERLQSESPTATLSPTLYIFLNRMRKDGVPVRRADGSEWPRGKRILWPDARLRIDEVEAFYREHRQTKLPDVGSFRIDGGKTIDVDELLFLLPKRALIEDSGKGVCDIARYFAAGRADSTTLYYALASSPDSTSVTLFETYGQTAEDRKLTLLPHSLRHIQNTELFRLGVADTIITKRFNRKSVAQSYEYDHRSLAETLEQVELPNEWAEFLGEGKAATVAKMIQAGRANGPIVREFKRIRDEEGDEAAFTYLKVEADGFHATPYGHCLNSFTVDPCPKHLECFSGCRHLSATDLPENRVHLVALEGRLQAAFDAATAKPSKSVGRTNQIEHARVRLDGVRALLATPPGERPFPNGPDLSLPSSTQHRSPLDGPT